MEICNECVGASLQADVSETSLHLVNSRSSRFRSCYVGMAPEVEFL